ncbi:MAG: flavin reductase family protein [Candidatus Thorarchaeota archaeon]|jgi:flavin reductase (DIM6/NTAB) family NADH-FMN oxidoreductase RutF
MKKKFKPFNAIVPCPVVLLSVKGNDENNNPNIITLSWAANVCSKPPIVVVGIRPSRYSYKLVNDAGDFVLNIPAVGMLNAAKFSGTKSGRDYNKFEHLGLTPKPSEKIDSPMIEECPLNIECKVTQSMNLGSHDLFVAEVLAVHLDESVLDSEKRSLDPNKMKLFTYLPIVGEYWSLGKKVQS